MKSLRVASCARHRAAAVLLRFGTVPASWGPTDVRLVALMSWLMLCVILLSSSECDGGKGGEKDDRKVGKKSTVKRKNDENNRNGKKGGSKKASFLVFVCEMNGSHVSSDSI